MVSSSVVKLVTSLVVHVFADLQKAIAIRSQLDCRLTSSGAEYTGARSHTSSYRACQRWDSQTPHAHTFIRASMFPDGSVSAAENHCRNPGGVREGPWCYTLHPQAVWEYCEIAQCGCRATKTGWEYIGTVSRTTSGKACQRWDTQHPHTHSYTVPESFPDPTLTHAHNFCRNPMQEGERPWCYTLDPKVRWEYCAIPFCECKTTESGVDYGGRISQTKSGKTCQRWDAQRPHTHRYYDSCLFPESEVGDAANYCRNPTPDERHAPWCYTTDPKVKWEYCEIPLCEINNASYAMSFTPSVGLWESVVGADEVVSNDDDVDVLNDPGVLAGVIASTAVVILGILIAIAMIIVTRRLRQLAQSNKADAMYEMPASISSKKERGLANPTYENTKKNAPRIFDYQDNTDNEQKEERYTTIKMGDMLDNRYQMPDI